MSERASTKGPWSVKHTDTTYYVESAEGIRIVSTSWHARMRKPYPLKAEAFANATMAAAAPDMFEALQCLPFGWLSAGVLSHPDADLLTIQMKVAGTVYEHEISVGQLRAAAIALAKAEGLGQRADATPKNLLPGEIAP